MEALSHRFLEALTEPRDRLYARARAAGTTPAAAEAALLQAVRTVFAENAANEYLDIPTAMEKQLPATQATEPALQETADNPMPADVWARVAATVQWEAARSAGALPADSQLLKPDPMLAPKRHKPRSNNGEFDTGSPKRLMTLIAAALLIGIAVTIYILIRSHISAAPANVHPASPTGASTPSAH